MARVEHLRPRADRRIRGPAPRHRPVTRALGRVGEESPRAASARRPPVERPVRDRGLGLLIMFTAGVLVMVALIILTGSLGSWWALVPVMVVDLAVTVAVLAVIVRLLND